MSRSGEKRSLQMNGFIFQLSYHNNEEISYLVTIFCASTLNLAIIWTDENLINFFEKIGPYLSSIHMQSYPLTDKLLRAIIDSCPKCTSAGFVNCGSNCDQNLVDNWNV